VSTFADLATRGAGVGVAYLLEGSTDLFVTTPYAYSTHDGLFGATTPYDQRIATVGDLQRGFGTDGVLAASTVSVELANIDGALDFLIMTPAIVFRLRWVLKVVLYDTAAPSDFAMKTLGTFVNLDHPKRSGSSIQLQLADDAFGQAAELAIPPTFGEALAGAVDPTTTEPPVPIALGGADIPAVLAPFGLTDTTVNLVLCATTDTAAVVQSEVEYLTISGPGIPDGFSISREMLLPDRDPPYGTLSYPLFGVAKTASLVKDGRTWRVLYVELYSENLKRWLYARFGIPSATQTVTAPTATATTTVETTLEDFNSSYLPLCSFVASGPKFSSRTFTTNGLSTTVRAPDIAYDLLRYYSRGLDAAQVDAASFATVTAAAPMYFFKAHYYFSGFRQFATEARFDGGVFGRTGRSSAYVSSVGVLRNAISELCQCGLFDVVTSWEGVFTAFVLANGFALQTGTPTPVDETLCSGISDRIPSNGERWAPYNRIVFASNGRTVDNLTAIADWGVVLTRNLNDSVVDIETGFSGTDFGIGTFGGIGNLESVVRPMLSFEYPLDALTWELGEFISFTWSRGASGLGAWSSAVFRIEALTLHPSRCTVSVQAVWIQDLVNTRPYLLDDETLLVRSKGALAGAGAWDSGFGWFTFGGTINLLTMGVQVGDILVLRDSTEAADSFLRNACFRIDTVAAGYCEILPVMTSTVSVANADWSIVRGATTYPTVVSDPTNYPSGGSMYGKLSEAGTFSDASPANIMQAG
jgi:hypothetical protein